MVGKSSDSEQDNNWLWPRPSTTNSQYVIYNSEYDASACPNDVL